MPVELGDHDAFGVDVDRHRLRAMRPEDFDRVVVARLLDNDGVALVRTTRAASEMACCVPVTTITFSVVETMPRRRAR